ncbi:hypothetical protein TSAR_015219 [Trichomalopsis sarcophagae]|uniref:Uncharacterized protein n=1 Tax=Trichomalopsis sarcophagae TaxID=543379 RepID=A0A232FD23_9HYME|nr:hypothetical protein TSAR_015219 [Trichomalopsis sarcophagae]
MNFIQNILHVTLRKREARYSGPVFRLRNKRKKNRAHVAHPHSAKCACDYYTINIHASESEKICGPPVAPRGINRYSQQYMKKQRMHVNFFR